MKIFIIGISGSGKSTLAKKIAKKIKLPHFDLDDIQFVKKYDEVRKSKDSKVILENNLKKNKKWIYEGIYIKWTKSLARDADLIIWLDLSKNLLSWWILKRGLKRKSETGETFFQIFSLIKFQRNYKKIRPSKNKSFFDIHNDLVRDYKNKLIIIRNKKDLAKFLENLK